MASMVIAVGASSCLGTDAEPDSRFTTTDSAGVRIAESARPASDSLPWEISDQPTVVIGAADGPDSQVLSFVYSATVLQDGRITLGNAGSHEVRIYDSGGTLETSFGREGEGPGEFGGFSSLRILDASNDSLAVEDAGNNRVQVFSPDGELLRLFQPAVIEGFGRPNLTGRFGTGGWLGFMPVGTGRLGGNVGEIIRSQFAFLRFAPDGASAEVITEVPGRPRVVNELGGGAIHFPYVPLTPDPRYAALRDGLLYNASGSAELREVSSEGRLRRVIRWAHPRIPRETIWDRYREDYIDLVPDDRRPSYARLLNDRGIPIPDSIPVVGKILLDASGFIWVQHYQLPWDSSARWSVFGSDGAWLGDMSTPDRLTVLQIGDDFILGRHVDELGVERIVLYNLERRIGSSP